MCEFSDRERSINEAHRCGRLEAADQAHNIAGLLVVFGFIYCIAKVAVLGTLPGFGIGMVFSGSVFKILFQH